MGNLCSGPREGVDQEAVLTNSAPGAQPEPSATPGKLHTENTAATATTAPLVAPKTTATFAEQPAVCPSQQATESSSAQPKLGSCDKLTEVSAKPTAKQRCNAADEWEEVNSRSLLSKEVVPLPATKLDADVGKPYRPFEHGPPVPSCEEQRLATVRALGRPVDAPPDPEIEAILKLVCKVFDIPNALVALFEEKRIFVSSGTGVFERGDFPWRWSFCGWTMATPLEQIMVIPDAYQDSRFCNNKFVQAGVVRFYVGTPLISANGHRLGTLCFADPQPRTFGAGQAMILNNLAEVVARQIEKDLALQIERHDNEQLQQVYKCMARAVDSSKTCVLFVNTSDPVWPVMYVNLAWQELTGLDRDVIMNMSIWEQFKSCTDTPVKEMVLEKQVKAQKEFVLENMTLRNADVGPVLLRFRPASRATIDDSSIPIGVPSMISANGWEGQPYYFVSVELPSKINTPVLAGQDGVTRSSMLSTRSSMMSLLGDCSDIEGLDLNHLLGRGGFGSVYKGTWFGTPVAVKVVDNSYVKRCNSSGVSLEAVLGQGVRHPHVVRTMMVMLQNNGSTMDPSRRTSMESTASWGPSKLSGDSSSKKPGKAVMQGWVGGANNSPGMGFLEDLMRSHDSSTWDTRCRAGSLGSLRPKHLKQGALNSANGFVISSTGENNITSGNFLVAGSAVANAQPCSGSGANNVTNGSGANNVTNGSGANNVTNSGSTGVVSTAGPTALTTTKSELGETWLLMEFCDKGSLQDAIDRGWLLSDRNNQESAPDLAAILVTAMEIASAMAHLHDLNIVHGDLSSFNVLLTTMSAEASKANRGFTSKIADFGLAHSVDVKTQIQTRSYGSISYMPPETLLQGIVSKAVDVYSFGVLLWQMYAVSRPWVGLSHGQIIYAVTAQRAMLQWPEGVPEAYQALAQQCMSFDAEERPSFMDICEMLEPLVEHLEIEGSAK